MECAPRKPRGRMTRPPLIPGGGKAQKRCKRNAVNLTDLPDTGVKHARCSDGPFAIRPVQKSTDNNVYSPAELIVGRSPFYDIFCFFALLFFIHYFSQSIFVPRTAQYEG